MKDIIIFTPNRIFLLLLYYLLLDFDGTIRQAKTDKVSLRKQGSACNTFINTIRMCVA